jgi:glycosyltransferase involved in cell wall biosynthesis
MKILFIAEVGSIHVARWVNQLHGTGWDFRIFQPVTSAYSVRGEFLSGHIYLPYDVNKPDSIRVEYTLTPKPLSLVTRAIRKGLRILKITSFDEKTPSLAIRAVRKGMRMLKIMPLEESLVSPDIRHAQFLADLIRQWRPDVIHSLGMFVNWRDNAIVLLRAREILGSKLPCPWIVSSWGIDMTLYPSLGEKEQAAVEAILAVCDGLLVEGDRDLPLAQKLGFRGKVLAKLPAYGGITWKPQDYCLPGLTSSRHAIILKGRDNSDHVLAGGDPQGRAMIAIKAFKICQNLLKSYSIIIVQATPSVEAEAKALAADGMDITIYSNSTSLPYEQWLKLLGSARILIAVTASDGLPSTLIEAMSLGVFPIHSGLETVREWINDGQNGLLVPPEDVQAVAYALQNALENDALVDKASEYNLAMIAKSLSDSVVRPQVIDLYKTLAQSDSMTK